MADQNTKLQATVPQVIFSPPLLRAKGEVDRLVYEWQRTDSDNDDPLGVTAYTNNADTFADELLASQHFLTLRELFQKRAIRLPCTAWIKADDDNMWVLHYARGALSDDYSRPTRSLRVIQLQQESAADDVLDVLQSIVNGGMNSNPVIPASSSTIKNRGIPKDHPSITTGKPFEDASLTAFPSLVEEACNLLAEALVTFHDPERRMSLIQYCPASMPDPISYVQHLLALFPAARRPPFLICHADEESLKTISKKLGISWIVIPAMNNKDDRSSDPRSTSEHWDRAQRQHNVLFQYLLQSLAMEKNTWVKDFQSIEAKNRRQLTKKLKDLLRQKDEEGWQDFQKRRKQASKPVVVSRSLRRAIRPTIIYILSSIILTIIIAVCWYELPTGWSISVSQQNVAMLVNRIDELQASNENMLTREVQLSQELAALGQEGQQTQRAYETEVALNAILSQQSTELSQQNTELSQENEGQRATMDAIRAISSPTPDIAYFFPTPSDSASPCEVRAVEPGVRVFDRPNDHGDAGNLHNLPHTNWLPLRAGQRTDRQVSDDTFTLWWEYSLLRINADNTFSVSQGWVYSSETAIRGNCTTLKSAPNREAPFTIRAGDQILVGGPLEILFQAEINNTYQLTCSNRRLCDLSAARLNPPPSSTNVRQVVLDLSNPVTFEAEVTAYTLVVNAEQFDDPRDWLLLEFVTAQPDRSP